MTSSFKMVPVDVDQLAQFIRKVNGDNRMGAGSLAEHIAEWLAAAPASPQAAQPVAWIVTDMNGEEYVTYNRQTPNDKPLYAHDDAGEVEQVKKELALCWDDRRKDRDEIRILRAQLVRANYVVERARAIDQTAFANGTSNVDTNLFRGLSVLLGQYDALSATAKPDKCSHHGAVTSSGYCMMCGNAKPEADHE